MTKTIETLTQDIYDLMDKGGEISEADLDLFAEGVKQSVRRQLSRNEEKPNAIRLSQLGKPCHKSLWYNHRGTEGEGLRPATRIKFLYGDIIEHLLILLARGAGHEVTDEQKHVKLDGVSGSIDCKIDGVTVDVKSASTYSFKKFKDGTLADDDAFGYIGQLSSYCTAEGESEGYFFVADKQHGTLTTHKVEVQGDVVEKNAVAKAAILSDQVPDRGFDSVPYGKSGNMCLGVNCSYCQYKQECWPELRTFLYSRGPVFLTDVVRAPKDSVPEVL